MIRTGRAARATAVIVGIVVGLTMFAAPAGAATGAQKFRIVYTGPNVTEETVGRVVASGVINGIGTDRSGDVEVITLPRGTITLALVLADVVTLPAGCVGLGTSTGTWSIVGGTGAYVSASGSGTLKAVVVVVATRTPHGCSPPLRQTAVDLTLTGTVSVP